MIRLSILLQDLRRRTSYELNMLNGIILWRTKGGPEAYLSPKLLKQWSGSSLLEDVLYGSGNAWVGGNTIVTCPAF